jgi:predicted nucleotidyltransferase
MTKPPRRPTEREHEIKRLYCPDRGERFIPSMAADESLRIVRRYLERLREEHLPVQGLVLYGSHARGNPGPDSDIDVLVLLDNDLTATDIDQLWTRLEHLALGVDMRIETWPVTLQRFENDEVSPLLIAVRREGIPVMPESRVGQVVEKT